MCLHLSISLREFFVISVVCLSYENCHFRNSGTAGALLFSTPVRWVQTGSANKYFQLDPVGTEGTHPPSACALRALQAQWRARAPCGLRARRWPSLRVSAGRALLLCAGSRSGKAGRAGPTRFSCRRASFWEYFWLCFLSFNKEHVLF